MNSRIATSPHVMLSVYDGRSCVGFILPRGKVGFEAFTASEKSCGLFATQQDAVASLSYAGNRQEDKSEAAR